MMILPSKNGCCKNTMKRRMSDMGLDIEARRYTLNMIGAGA